MTTQLIDGFGRVHRDLRISVTDRCNFRCTYCMPQEGMQWQRREDLLSFEEIERVAQILVERFGVNAIRLTGGEPTVRAKLSILVAKLAALNVDLAMTTNGVTLPLLANELRAAGLTRINISLDSLRADRFEQLTRRNELPRVLEGVDAALDAGFSPVKVNVVVMKGVNDDEIVDFARFGRDRGVVVRFIEFMPLDADEIWSNDQVMTQTEILKSLSGEFDLVPLERTSAPATRWRYADGLGEIGIVASVSQSFCESCDRVRITADGQFRNCLFATEETDVRALLRNGASDDDIAEALQRSVSSKWAGHSINQVHFIRPHRSMSEIGG
ncbi:MAG: GTP 3',8-cyclase MoaA [Acidimicrobiaceae bacterium]|nr:GTP 3',8-cyclase MoaA [Acidimicrobiaceae bacterium]MXW76279.1 GTP 3',8-cyclase MoaA [Acidimicrobiaceae bacterium]MYA74480.1 GTP 3',8-cyclase MoaA [Acidimicrobiaceae bacterium]MYC43877.1 GTP 3',8-cyclase MoaA [Acidimicrobiaceae bacterium]MYD07771.1 GTP 3',8-cyclase MoaA [Acidimicrobiaceae bacterium]